MNLRLERSVYLRSQRWHYTIHRRDDRTTAALPIFDSRMVVEHGFQTYEDALLAGTTKRTELERLSGGSDANVSAMSTVICEP
jgi:hypothetical protein